MSFATVIDDEQHPYRLLSSPEEHDEYPTYAGIRLRPPLPAAIPLPPGHRLFDPADNPTGIPIPPPPPPYVADPVAGAQWQARLLLDEAADDNTDAPATELTIEPYRRSSAPSGATAYRLFQRPGVPLVEGTFEWDWAEHCKSFWRKSLMPGQIVGDLDREMYCNALWDLTVASAKQPLGTEEPNTLPEHILYRLTFKSCPATITTTVTVKENDMWPGSKAFECQAPRMEGSYHWLDDVEETSEAQSALAAIEEAGQLGPEEDEGNDIAVVDSDDED